MLGARDTKMRYKDEYHLVSDCMSSQTSDEVSKQKCAINSDREVDTAGHTFLDIQ